MTLGVRERGNQCPALSVVPASHSLLLPCDSLRAYDLIGQRTRLEVTNYFHVVYELHVCNLLTILIFQTSDSIIHMNVRGRSCFGHKARLNKRFSTRHFEVRIYQQLYDAFTSFLKYTLLDRILMVILCYQSPCGTIKLMIWEVIFSTTSHVGWLDTDFIDWSSISLDWSQMTTKL